MILNNIPPFPVSIQEGGEVETVANIDFHAIFLYLFNTNDAPKRG
jgi:hypothetical protein